MRVDDRPLPLTLTDVDVSPYLTVQAGYGTVRLTVEARGAPTGPGAHRVLFRNDFARTPICRRAVSPRGA